MPLKVKIPSSSQIEELRQRFNTKYANSPPAAPFHPADLARIRDQDLWLQRFLEMQDLDIGVAFNQLWDTCVWRQSFGANDLFHTELNQEYLNNGFAFVHNVDVDGKPLLILRVGLHDKSRSVPELLRLIFYWVEREQRQNNLVQVSLFYDMTGASLSSLDTDLVKGIVEIFKMYYPNTLNYIFVFELAWLLTAAFKVIKALLPPKAVEIMKMITKKDITQYVSKDNCLASWGGTDNYTYSFVPEPKLPSLPTSTPTKPMAANAGADEGQPQLQDMAYDKKVHFAKSAPMVLHDTNIGDMHTPSDGEGMLLLDETEFLNFSLLTGEAKLTLSNIASTPIVYKIQTTSPEKFRVRPRCGIIQISESVEVNIWLKSDHQLNQDGKDKFLVMASYAPSAECSSQEVAEIWKERATSDPQVEHHRLVCRQVGKSKDAAINESGSKDPTAQQLQVQSKQMDSHLKFMSKLIYVLIVMCALLFSAVAFLMYAHVTSPSYGAGWGAADACPRTKPFKCDKHK